jgi:Flp pilus assembly protein, ATPase CpaF
MLELELKYEDGRSERRRFDLPLVMGRDDACSLRFKSWRVARQHARIAQRSGILFIEDFGSLIGTYVNGRRVTEYGPLTESDEIIVGPCCMRLLGVPNAGVDRDHDLIKEGNPITEPAMDGHPALRETPTSFTEHASPHQRGVPSNPPENQSDLLSRQAAGRHCSLTAASLLPAASSSRVSPGSMLDSAPKRNHGDARTQHRADTHDPAYLLGHRRRLHKALLDALDLRRRDILSLSDAALRQEAHDALSRLLDGDLALPTSVDRATIIQDVVNEAVGLGPLEPLIEDPTVSEIMVNAHDDIYVERAGLLQRHAGSFSSDHAVLAVIERIIAPLGRRIDESSPMVDARLKDGSRVNAVIPPIALRGPCVTIRKFPSRRLEMSDLLAVGSLDEHMGLFLERCIQARKSLVVSGGTGSGKTTLLNVLSNCIPHGERLITIEDAAELRLNHSHLISLEARPANAEGKGCVQIRDLVRNALRMRPDRIIVGECRGAEAFDMLAAMNTGHEGSLTTLHANTPRDALSRLETMVLMAGLDLPLSAIRDHIASAIELIVQQARLSDGRRLITSIVEVTGIEGGRIQTQELFRYKAGPEPRFEGCGIQPECFIGDAEGVPMSCLTQSTRLAVESPRSTW